MLKLRLAFSIKTRIWQLCLGNRDQTSCEVIENRIDDSFACPKLCDYLFIKAGKDLVPRVLQVLVDLVLKVLLQKVELLLDFFIGSLDWKMFSITGNQPLRSHRELHHLHQRHH